MCTETSDDPGLILATLVSRLSSHGYMYFYTATDKGKSGSFALSITLAVAVRCASLCAAYKGAGADKSSSERREVRSGLTTELPVPVVGGGVNSNAKKGGGSAGQPPKHRDDAGSEQEREQRPGQQPRRPVANCPVHLQHQACQPLVNHVSSVSSQKVQSPSVKCTCNIFFFL